MANDPGKLGNSFKNTSLVTPLNAEAGKADPGPPILNNPVLYPPDQQGFLKMPSSPGGKGGK